MNATLSSTGANAGSEALVRVQHAGGSVVSEMNTMYGNMICVIVTASGTPARRCAGRTRRRTRPTMRRRSRPPTARQAPTPARWTSRRRALSSRHALLVLELGEDRHERLRERHRDGEQERLPVGVQAGRDGEHDPRCAGDPDAGAPRQHGGHRVDERLSRHALLVLELGEDRHERLRERASATGGSGSGYGRRRRTRRCGLTGAERTISVSRASPVTRDNA